MGPAYRPSVHQLLQMNYRAVLIDLVVFQLEWWLCVLSGNQTIPYGYIFAAFLLIKTRYRAFYSLHFSLEWLLLTAIGLLTDIIMIHSGVYQFPPAQGLILPYWLMVLWMCFAAWFISAEWINHRALLMSGLAAIGGVGAYNLGHTLGSIQFNQTNALTSMYLTVVWAVLGLVCVGVHRVMTNNRPGFE